MPARKCERRDDARHEFEPIYQFVAAKMRHIRQAIGLNQAELAKRIGKSRPTVANIEAGRQRIQMHDVETIANALGTTPKFLLKGLWW